MRSILSFMKNQLCRDSITRSTLFTSKILLIRLFLQASTLIVLAKILGAKNFGIFAGLSAAAVIAGSLSTFGMHFILLRASSRKDSNSTNVAEYALWTTLITGALMLIVYLVTLHFLSFGASKYTVLALGVSETIIQPFILLSCMEHQAKNQIAKSQAIFAIPIALRCSAAFFLLAWPSENVELTYSGLYLASAAIGLFAAIRLQPEKWPMPGSWRKPTLSEAKDASGFAIQNVTTLGPSEVDKSLAAKLLDADLAGHYSLSVRIISAATLPIMALMISALPALFNDLSRAAEKPKEISIFMLSGTYGSMLAILIWLGSPLVERAFGNDYAYLSETLPYLSFFAISLSLRISGTTILTARSMPFHRSAIEGIGVFLLIFLSLSLLPKHGVIALCLAVTISETAMAAMAWCTLLKENRNE